MSRRSGGLRLSREKLVCCFPLFSEKRGKLPFRHFQCQINHMTRFLLQSPFILYIGTSEEPTAGQEPANMEVFWVGSFCIERGCCSSDVPRLHSASSVRILFEFFLHKLLHILTSVVNCLG